MTNLAKYSDFRNVEVEDGGGSHNLLFKLNRDILVEQNTVIFPEKILGKYVNITTGAIVTNASYNTAIIDVAETLSVTYITPAMGGVNSGYCFKNSEGDVILGVKTLNNVLTEIEVPQNAVTFVCTWFVSGDANQIFYLRTYTTETAKTQLARYNKTYLFNKEFRTLGDSLSADGVWQKKLAELTGSTFNSLENKNNLSVGGTSTLAPNYASGQYRALKLLADYPNTEVIFYQNVNDFDYGLIGEITDVPFMVGTTHDYGTVFSSSQEAYEYFDVNIVDILDAYPIAKSTAVFLKIESTGKNIKINTTATSEGQIGISVGGIGHYFAITTSMSIEDIVDLIIETSFLPYNAVKIGNNSISFNSTNVAFLSNSIGVTSTLTNVSNAQSTIGKFFVGESVEADWLDTNNWKQANQISTYSKIKGITEFLCTNFPMATIYMLSFPVYRLASTEFRREDGTFDIDSYVNDPTTIKNEKIIKVHNDMQTLYNIKHINIKEFCGINGFNFTTYYNYSNVHPKIKGYEKIAEVISTKL